MDGLLRVILGEAGEDLADETETSSPTFPISTHYFPKRAAAGID
jgi:hypothetical protein